MTEEKDCLPTKDSDLLCSETYGMKKHKIFNNDMDDMQCNGKKILFKKKLN